MLPLHHEAVERAAICWSASPWQLFSLCGFACYEKPGSKSFLQNNFDKNPGAAILNVRCSRPRCTSNEFPPTPRKPVSLWRNGFSYFRAFFLDGGKKQMNCGSKTALYKQFYVEARRGAGATFDHSLGTLANSVIWWCQKFTVNARECVCYHGDWIGCRGHAGHFP